MKNNIINYLKFVPLLLVMIFTSCDNDDVTPEFTLSEASEDLSFSFTAADEYMISTGTMSNVAERFVWNEVDFGVATEISYQLQGSVDSTFDAYDSTTEYDSGTLSVTNAEVKVSDLNNLATLLGLEAGDSGLVYFRARAFAGSGEGVDTVDTYSEVMTLNISILEESSGSGIEISSWGVVGSGYNDWGNAGPDAPFYTTTTAGVVISYVNLVDGEIKFRENNEWNGTDVGDANSDGVLDTDDNNNIAVTAGDYKITINTNDNSYTIEEFTWGVVGDYNGWGATPDAKFYYDYTTDTFKAGVYLTEGGIKFRMNNDWNGSDVGDANLDGIVDTDSDNNIPVTDGYYLITLDLNSNSYIIEEATLWGLVGDFNSWGETTDFHLTEVNPGMWIGSGANLIDGFIKFRPNDTWDGDYGDANNDGVLDRDSDNNIAVEAGNYVVMIDFTDESAPAYTLIKR
tara:strand:- start:12609 stop:13979 length:1371 start_codon:yes stop_codon:yes gene_type:complete